MNRGPQMGMAVVAGYVLGRRRKMRMALALGAAASTGGLGRGAGAVASRGRKAMGASSMLGKVTPDLSEITGMIRGELLEAGKSAAAAAVSGRIESLSDRLHERAESIRTPSAGRDEDEDGDGREPDDERRASRKDRDEPREDDEEYEPEEDEDEDEEEAPERRPRAATRARSSRSGTEAPVRRRR